MLRATLVTNGISTALCGLALLVAPGPLATLLGVPTPGVVAGAALLERGLLTPIGAGLVALVAAVVFVFAALQYRGVRRLARSEPSAA